jgi:hypothetical protein
MEIMTKFLRPHSLSQRLLVSVGLSITTVGLATLGLNYRLMQSDLETQVHNRAQSITQSLEFSTEGLLELENKSILRRVVQNFATMPGVLEIAIVDPSGMAIARSPQNTTNGPYTSSIHNSRQRSIGRQPQALKSGKISSWTTSLRSHKFCLLAVPCLAHLNDGEWRSRYSISTK